MNVALIIAGGTGSRMKQVIPKQFLNVFDKPIIVYTLEAFQSNPLIDAIELVCLEGWTDVAKAYASQFNITKLKWITLGGTTGQESIKAGLDNLKNEIDDDDIVIIHDGIRPLIEQDVISDVINKCVEFGNAVTSTPCNDQIFVSDDSITTTKYIPRDTLVKVTTPQAYKYGKIFEIYEKAFKENKGIGKSTYANTLMVEYGEILHLSLGSEKNIKLTTPEDIEIFKSLLHTQKEEWMK